MSDNTASNWHKNWLFGQYWRRGASFCFRPQARLAGYIAYHDASGEFGLIYDMDVSIAGRGDSTIFMKIYPAMSWRIGAYQDGPIPCSQQQHIANEITRAISCVHHKEVRVEWSPGYEGLRVFEDIASWK
jgi:hypothetical protein